MNAKLILKYIESFGLLAGATAYYKTHHRNTRIAQVRLRGIKHPVYLRLGDSDVSVFNAILVFGQYDLKLDFEPFSIIDGGGNIGLASVFFANKYPSARIVCVEPSPRNYSILQMNVRSYSNIQPCYCGIWSTSTSLQVKDHDSSSWSDYTVEVPEGTEGTIPARSIPELIDEGRFDEIDILKLDVEGAEKEIFSGNHGEWLPHVKVLIVETHDWKKKGSSRSVIRALSQYDFSLKLKGENLIFYREGIQRPK